jgi:hypothetical protein
VHLSLKFSIALSVWLTLLGVTSFLCATHARYVNAPSGPVRLRTYIPDKNKLDNCRIWEAGRATAAAPRLFDRISIGREGEQIEFIDGAMGANNPIRELVDEAVMLYGAERKVACVISIGTGVANVINYDQSGFWEKIFRKNLIASLVKLAADSDKVAEEMEKKYRAATPTMYWRLNVDRGLNNIRLDEWQDLGGVKTYAHEYLRQNQATGIVDEIVAALTITPEAGCSLSSRMFSI